MTYESVLAELNTYRQDEQINKEYYLLKKENKSLASFFAKYKNEPLYIHILQHPEKINSTPTEDTFILSGRNVSIIKHPRFLPLFNHKHLFFEMIYVLSGSCTQRFDDKTLHLSAGDLCIMAPDVSHAIEVFDDSIILNILIRKSTFLDIFMNTVRDKTQISMFFLNNIYEKNRIPYLLFHTGNDTHIRNYVLDMYMEHMNADEYSDRIICSILTIFFTQLIRRHKKHLEIPDIYSNHSKHETEILNYILNNYASVTLEDVAQHFHFSVPHCSKLIKRFSGQSFSDLLENIRLQKAENYLLFTKLNIAEISDKIGFKNPESFIRMFKRRHNMTPSKFRKTHMEL